MNIAVAGMGYVGLSMAVLLAQHNQVYAVDILADRVEMVNKGISPIDDKELKGLDLPNEKADNILFANFEKRVGKAPKPMDKEKFKAYIEKYSFALTEKEMQDIKVLMEKYL